VARKFEFDKKWRENFNLAKKWRENLNLAKSGAVFHSLIASNTGGKIFSATTNG
jgi:hypothetical protein